jgi:hypothetical protein
LVQGGCQWSEPGPLIPGGAEPIQQIKQGGRRGPDQAAVELTAELGLVPGQDVGRQVEGAAKDRQVGVLGEAGQVVPQSDGIGGLELGP